MKTDKRDAPQDKPAAGKKGPATAPGKGAAKTGTGKNPPGK